MFGISIAIPITMKSTITIPEDLYKSLSKIAYERGFDVKFFIIQLLEHDLEVWQKQLTFINHVFITIFDYLLDMAR